MTATEPGAYKNTVNLPQTNFDMRANATKREPELQQFWAEQQIYEHLSQENPGDVFVLHDGPPYANGTLHMGHALNKVLKDIINKYQLLQGRKVRYVPGWDCHGLPIELKVLQNLKPEVRKTLTPLELRHKARDFALETIAQQSQAFQRYGVWGDWQHPYMTLTPDYEAAQIGVFGKMVLNGHIYRGLKPVHWSPSSKTALAEAELEYPEGHTSQSIYAAFPMIAAGEKGGAIVPYLPNLKVAIWTTTPWTIPANLAVAVNPELTYAIVEVQSSEFGVRSSEPPATDALSSAIDALPLAPDALPSVGNALPLAPDALPSVGNALPLAPDALLSVGDTLPLAPDALPLAPNTLPSVSEIQGGHDDTALTTNPALPTPHSALPTPHSQLHLIVALDLVERLSAVLSVDLTVKATLSGKDLEYSTYRHPLFDRESPIVVGGDYVTTESGTGLVHTAPGHGQEDYLVGQRYGLPILAPVDGDGNFTAEAGPFAGLNVLGEGNQAVIDALQAAGSLLKQEAYVHKYPYDWRTKKPTIFRATEQWFCSVAGFRDQALAAIGTVQWIPAQGENRITAMVSERSDWCISRQRSWGVPIPVFYDEATGEPLLNQETIAHVQQLFAAQGSDAWWELSVAELLPEPYRHNGHSYRKGMDTMDVWFDSGSSWAAVAQQRPELAYPVDIYLEGSDQHRGWFQSSLLTSVATNGHAPYKTVLTHGFTVDEKGRKMSKSLGNGIDPLEVINGGKNQQQDPAYGADVLRLWVSSADYASEIAISKGILKQLADVSRKIRNTARFLLGNLHDFDPAQNAVPYGLLPELDRYMLHRMTEVFEDVTDAFETFQFFRFFQTVQNFCVVDLSNFYLDIAKDRLYISSPDSPRRRSCQTVLAVAIENLARAIAPVLCHMAEDIWQSLPYAVPQTSVFQAGWVQLNPQWRVPALAESWVTLRQIRAEVNKVMEQARVEKAIGSSLEAKVLLYVEDATLRQRLQTLNSSVPNHVDELRYLFIVSQVEVLETPELLTGLKYTTQAEGIAIGVTDADGQKCDRCWNYSTYVGQSGEHPLLCDRCIPALIGEF